MPKVEVLKKERKAPVKKRKNAYKKPNSIPNGELLIDLGKKKWIIGASVGVGGFGEIYSASSESQQTDKSAYVIKIEPHENGPLFVEMHFYMRIAKEELINEWQKKNKIPYLGMPRLYGLGSHEYNGEKYRFIVIDRYGKDLWSIFEENNRRFPVSTVLKVGLQIIDVLQYVHEKGYVHADIKGSNLLLGIKKGTENQVHLVDYGLAGKYSAKEFKPDKKRAHNGTIEYTSRDAHHGVISRRGDLEILAFNMLQWIVSFLPWETDLDDPVKVHQQKEEFMKNVPASLKKLKSQVPVPSVIEEFLNYTKKLAHDEEPEYNYCRKLFKDGLKKCGDTSSSKLEFNEEKSKGNSTPSGRKAVKKPLKRSSTSSDEEQAESEEEVPKVKAKKKVTAKKISEKGKANGNAMSWKDFPTIVASNIGKPGELKSPINPRASKRAKK